VERRGRASSPRRHVMRTVVHGAIVIGPRRTHDNGMTKDCDAAGWSREHALEVIRHNIETSGFHIYVVGAGIVTPRFAYTIGLRESLGAELVLAGALYYETTDDVLEILHAVRKQLAKATHSKLGSRWHAEVTVRGKGTFTLRKAAPPWSKLLLGALDYYQLDDIDAYQIVPDSKHRTIDVPDMTRPWCGADERIWNGTEAWPYTVPEDSRVMMPLDVLLGEPVTEVARWEEDYWEMFADVDRPSTEGEARLVSLGFMLAVDPSLELAVDLGIGQGLEREDTASEWIVWESSSRDD
jgi:hypothetical protein